jgi:hypothetical protein
MYTVTDDSSRKEKKGKTVTKTTKSPGKTKE